MTDTRSHPRRGRLLLAVAASAAPLVLASCGQGWAGGTVAGDVRAAGTSTGTTSTPNGAGQAKTATPAPAPTPVVPPVPEKPLRVSSLTPSGKGPYGVGTIVTVDLSEVVAKSSRKAVQERLSVITSKPVGTTSWTWLDADTLAFRPKKFWPAGVVVTVRASISGLRLGKNADGYRLVGTGTKVVRFTIGRSQVTGVNGDNQMATVVRNGKVIRKIPVSMGKAGWRTRNGVKTVMDFERNHVYTNDAVGDFTEEYRLVGAHNLRLTWSGEFFHSAPWASGRLGAYAGSHGCTNASNTDARWMFDNSLVGDPMVYVNTGGSTMEVNNGLGGPWNIPWKTWVAKSAAKAVPTYRAPATPAPKPAPKPTSPTPAPPVVGPTSPTTGPAAPAASPAAAPARS